MSGVRTKTRPATATRQGIGTSPPAEVDESAENQRMYVARTELILARSDEWPLRAAPIKPDPLGPFAFAFAGLDDSLGDEAEVIFDLLPLTRGETARRRQRLARKLSIAEGSAPTRWALVGSVTLKVLRAAMGVKNGPSRGAAPKRGVAKRDESERVATVANALKDPAPHFQIQILVRAKSEVAGRPQRLMQSLLAGFESFGGANYLRAAGRRFFGRHVGQDVFWRRRRFDRRAEVGVFRPSRRRQVVSSSVIAGIMKPPTKSCGATNVVRSGGVVPPPPRNLPRYTYSAEQLPWGVVSYDEGPERVVAVNCDDTFFTWTGGRSRYGKSETSLTRFIHLARAGGCGVMYLDPHSDALVRAKPFLAGQAHRVLELSIARSKDETGTGLQVAWNPLSMEGCTHEDIEEKATALVDAIASALGWGAGQKAPRALTLLQNGTQSLLELSLQLPDEIAPTIFQFVPLLSSVEWRELVIPRLSPYMQEFWLDRFPRFPDEAITPITNLIDRLHQLPSVAALFGRSRSTYDLRRAMDTGAIVLVRLRSTGTINSLVASLVVFDLVRAVLSRWDLPPEERTPMHAFLDEVQSYDHSVNGLIAAMLEEGGKFGLRLHLLSQQPNRLTPKTLNAVLTNRSHLMTTALGHKSAKLLADEWQGLVTPATVQQLERYHFLTQVTDAGELSSPFRCRGLILEDLFGAAPQGATLDRLETAITRNSGREPIRDTLATLGKLNDRIADYLSTRGRRSTEPTKVVRLVGYGSQGDVA